MRRILSKTLAFTYILFSMFTSTAQNSPLDSLITLLKSNIQDTSRVNLLNEIGGRLINRSDFNTSVNYLSQAKALAEKLEFKKGLATSLNRLGIINERQSRYTEALECYTKVLELRREMHDGVGVANAINNIGIVYSDQTDYNKALEQYFRAYKLREEIKDSSGIVNSEISIGNIFFLQKDFSKCLEYYFRALKNLQSQNNKPLTALILNNIGLCYGAQKNYPLTLEYSFKSLKLEEEMGNKDGIATSFVGIGQAYEAQKEYQNAVQYFLKASSIFEELGSKKSLAECYLLLGNVYSLMNNSTKALSCFHRVVDLSREIGSKKNVCSGYQDLSHQYGKQGDFKNAYKYYQLYSALNDSIFNETNSKHIAELEAKYENEKKEKEIKLLQSNNEIQQLIINKKRIQTIALIVGIIFIFLLALTLISRQSIKTKKQKESFELQQKLILADLEKNRLEKQNLQLEAEKNIEKLNNSTALIQEKTRLLDKMNEEFELFKMENKGAEISAEQLLNTVKESADPEQYWEEFIANFNLVYKDFLERLTAKFPDLTRNEIRLCILIKCNLGNKEIANVLHISADSVKKANQRIRKKLGLDLNTNIRMFIQQLS